MSVPNPKAPNAILVSNGNTLLGTMVERDNAFFTFDAKGALIGAYASDSEAMRSIQVNDTLERSTQKYQG